MRRLTVVMSQQERVALDEIARRELRTPRECVRFLIRQAAVSSGVLTKEDADQGGTNTQEASYAFAR